MGNLLFREEKCSYKRSSGREIDLREQLESLLKEGSLRKAEVLLKDFKTINHKRARSGFHVLYRLCKVLLSSWTSGERG